MNQPATLALDRLTISLSDRPLINDVSLRLLPGGITVIVGGSGAGKSVFLRTLAGLVPPHDPAIHWDGKIRIGQVSADSTAFQPLPAARVGIVFQNFALLDQWSPGENVQLAIDHRSHRDNSNHEDGPSSHRDTQSAAAWLDELRVPSDTPVSVLSGGQKQRLAIARTLAANPDIIFYDEPTSGLDSASGRQVAQLIRHTQQAHRRTSVVVTHDYHTLLPIADDVLLLDAATQTLRRIDRSHWTEVADQIVPVQPSQSSPPHPQPTAPRQPNVGPPQTRPATWARWTTWAAGAISTALLVILAPLARGAAAIDRVMVATGAATLALVGRRADHSPRRSAIADRTQTQPGPLRARWLLRFFLDYLRLIGGLSAMLYLTVAGLIVGFTATYFTFEFLPYRVYSKPLLLEDLLASIGFALYRILVPVLATILVAARCGAAITADVGVKRYGAQIDALRTLGIRPHLYLLLPIGLACLIATPLLTALAFHVSRLISAVCFEFLHPELGPYFWQQHFHGRISGGWLASGGGWVLLKTLLCGGGIALISYLQGNRRKQSASDVSQAITSTVLWSTLYVLVVHFLVALQEF